jgi:hypothetical protein
MPISACFDEQIQRRLWSNRTHRRESAVACAPAVVPVDVGAVCITTGFDGRVMPLPQKPSPRHAPELLRRRRDPQRKLYEVDLAWSKGAGESHCALRAHVLLSRLELVEMLSGHTEPGRKLVQSLLVGLEQCGQHLPKGQRPRR